MQNFCPKCGAKLEPHSEFCPKCGTKLNTGSKITKPTLKVPTVSQRRQQTIRKKHQ